MLNCRPYTTDQPDWIAWLASRVTVAVYFDIPRAGEGQFMTTAEISDKLVSWGSIKKPMSMSRLGMVLQQAGFQSKRIGKKGMRGWIVRERGLEEVNANRNIEGRG